MTTQLRICPTLLAFASIAAAAGFQPGASDSVLACPKNAACQSLSARNTPGVASFSGAVQFPGTTYTVSGVADATAGPGNLNASISYSEPGPTTNLVQLTSLAQYYDEITVTAPGAASGSTGFVKLSMTVNGSETTNGQAGAGFNSQVGNAAPVSNVLYFSGNKVVQATIQIQFGAAFTVDFMLSASAYGGAPYSSGSASYSAFLSGFQVLDANMNPISNASVTSAAGIQYVSGGGSAPQPLQIPGGGGSSTVTLTNAIVNIPYTQTLTAIGGTQPYSWSLVGGALPSGVSLSSSGVLSGIPIQVGTANFTAAVTDSARGSVTSTFSLTVLPQPLSITTLAPLPSGFVNSPYPSQVLTASGGNPPYSFQATNLPAGLTLTNGAITGTPAAAGNSTVTLKVTDSSSPAVSTSGQFPITINPARADILLSQTTVAFSVANGSTGLPPAARISVQSSSSSQVLNYSYAASPALPWLTVSGGSSTPGALTIALTPQALQQMSNGQTSVIVTCVAPSPCAGNTQKITVSLTLTAAEPQLTLTSSLVAFSVPSGGQAVAQTLGIQNTGGGTFTINSVTSTNRYVTVSGVPGAPVGAGPAVLLTITIDPSTLAPGFYQSSIVVSTSAGSATVPVTVLVSNDATMTLSPSGTQLQSITGALPGNPNGSFQVSLTGAASVQWTATLLPGSNWLTLNTASGTSTPANPGTVNFAINSGAMSLAPQPYYAAIQIASPSVVDSPLTFIVVLNVTATGVAATPAPSPAGLLFLSSGSAPSSQKVTVYASSATPVSYQASSDSSWLTVSPALGQTSSSSPGTSTISVNPNGLSNRQYSGGVSYALAGGTVVTVNVTLILEPGVTTSARQGESPRASGCTPSHLVPTQIGLVNTFSLPAGLPTPISILLVNDCGQPVTKAQVIASFSDGDSSLPLTAIDTVRGIYTATWTPLKIAQQVTVTVSATATGLSTASSVVSGQVTPGGAPVLTPNGTVDAFATAAETGIPLAPGTIVQIYGSNLTSQTTPASTVPLPTSLNQTSVMIGGINAPLYYVSPGQINAQVPFELTAGKSYQVVVNSNKALSTPIPIQLIADSPGIAQFASGTIIAQHPDYSLVTETAPAAPGEYLTIYVAGMGLTNQTVPSGTASPLANVLDTPILTLGGSPVTNVLYAGLTPTVVGLYQINFQVPASAGNGAQQLVLQQAGGVSTALVPVHN